MLERRPYQRYDWPSLRAAYVEGYVTDEGERRFPSLREVAELFEVPPQRVRERSAREHWTDGRAAFQSNVEKVRQERRSSELGKEAVDLDKRALQVSKNGLQLVAARIGEIAQELQRVNALRAAGGPEADFLPSAVNAGEQVQLARAASEWHALAQRALGEVPTQRVEVTGTGGGPVRTDVRAELSADDPFRLFKFLQAAQNVGLVTGFDHGTTAIAGISQSALEAAAGGADTSFDAEVS